jgi:hypothetical protein
MGRTGDSRRACGGKSFGFGLVWSGVRRSFAAFVSLVLSLASYDFPPRRRKTEERERRQPKQKRQRIAALQTKQTKAKAVILTALQGQGPVSPAVLTSSSPGTDRAAATS